MICKECKSHSYNFLPLELQRDARRKYADCKNICYDEDGNEIGQCGCYGPEHGEGEYL